MPSLRRGDNAPSLVVIGMFDGVHLGHTALISRAVSAAKSGGLVPLALTFDPHPALTLGRSAPPTLTSLTRKVALLKRAGVQDVIVRRFDRDFSQWSPERFAEELLQQDLLAKQVLVGRNFRFGQGAAGTAEKLREFGNSMGFSVEGLELVSDREGGEPISSTRIRTALAEGDVALATRLLGRAFQVRGKVVHGDARGRTLGFPTANLGELDEMSPARGVYAVRATLTDGRLLDAVCNIGIRPTATRGLQETFEAHLLDFEGDLYDSYLDIAFHARLRGELKFSSLDALREQIHKDIESARQIFSARPS